MTFKRAQNWFGKLALKSKCEILQLPRVRDAYLLSRKMPLVERKLGPIKTYATFQSYWI